MALRTTLFVSLALALAGGAARADKVDWSQYVDKDAKPTPPAPVASDPVATKPAKATKKVATKPKAKAKSKARRRH